MIDLATVVFRDELSVLKLQAQSIDLHCQDIGIQNIYVIVNDNQATADQIDTQWWGALANQVTVIPRSAFSTQFVENGWVSQQVLKLLAASISYNVWTMALDAKTIFVRSISLANLIGQDGRACIGAMDIFPVFEPARLRINQTYNIDLQQQLKPGGVPFLFHNDVVRSMISETKFLVKKSFPLWFQEQGIITEFMLYAGYLQYKFKNFDSYYSQGTVAACNLCHSEVENFNAKFWQMSHPDTQTVSIHRDAWTQLTDGQKKQYQDLLISRGITTAYDL